ncbi:unnamed protein product, partial [Scytosiphon promiscuus]
EEEEYVFQFGTVNLSDEDAAGEDAGLNAPQDAGPEARHSPENLRYEDRGGVGDEVLEGAPVVAGPAGVVDGGDGFAPVSPAVEGVEPQLDGEATGAGDANGYVDGDQAGSSRQPIQTEQLRGGVFFPAHPPPPPPPAQQQQQQSQDARLAPPPFPNQSQAGGVPMQQQQQQQHHHQQHHQHVQLPHQHQQQMPPPQQQQQQQQRGFLPVEGGMHGMPPHQLHPHQHQVQMPIQQQQQQQQQRGGGGMGVGGGHPTHNSGGGMHHRGGPSFPKGPRGSGGGGRGGSAGSHSPSGAPLMPMGPGHYGGTRQHQQQHQQAGVTGYWGGGMMHYQVPGQPIMGPAPGGIGVTDGQAVYYPPPAHMLVQGDGTGMNGLAGAAP